MLLKKPQVVVGIPRDSPLGCQLKLNANPFIRLE